ncbi:MAG TPA: hypothetical protein VK031_07975 [Tissierellaceae bacterium]|nr:hypothetical protein [Tissierellaceae bacterium]
MEIIKVFGGVVEALQTYNRDVDTLMELGVEVGESTSPKMIESDLLTIKYFPCTGDIPDTLKGLSCDKLIFCGSVDPHLKSIIESSVKDRGKEKKQSEDIRNKREELENKIKSLKEDISSLQDMCLHPYLKKEYSSSGGGWDDSTNDMSWIDFSCPDCGKRWSEDY